MKKGLLGVLFFSIIVCGNLFSQTPGGYVPNEMMVMLEPGNTVDDLLTELNGQGLVGQYRMKQELSKRYKIYLLEHDAILGDSKKLIYDIGKMDQVAIVQLNHYIEERIAPDDPSYAPLQWNMNNTGQTGGTTDADIDAPEAWGITTGGLTADGDTIVVAIVDGGVQKTHPDLQNNMWNNYVELAGTAGVDDDGNGYIDDFYGWDAVGNDNAIPNNAHATHCAGIAGANGNNATGVTGVNWNVKILNVRGSSGTESVVVLAYDYVSSLRELYNNTNGTMGAFIVATSNSFGVNNGLPASYPLWCAMYDTMGVLGILSSAAGPNADINIDTDGDIPTTCPSNYLIAVTNTTNTDARNSSCGYGPVNMDIGAPGTNIYSTYTTSTYSNLTGTSMATPHVAGAIGLYYSAACLQFIQDYKVSPGALAQQMKTYLLTGVDSISSMAAITYSQGRLNIYKGILNVLTYNCLASPVGQFSANDQTICIGTTVNYTDETANNPTSWNWTFSGGTPGSSIVQNPFVTYNSIGVYDVQLIASNALGSDTVLLTGYITVSAIPAVPVISASGGILSSSYNGVGNQWYDTSGVMVGATADTLLPAFGNTYYVVYTDSNGCSATSAPFMFIGIEETFAHFSIYPNPATDKLIIDAGTITNANIKLMDLSGRMVMTSIMNQSLFQLDVSSLANGIYIIRIEYGDKSVTRKIIKR